MSVNELFRNEWVIIAPGPKKIKPIECKIIPKNRQGGSKLQNNAP